MCRKIIVTLMLGILQGCATVGMPTFSADVDSISDPSKPNLANYILLPGNEGVDDGDLQYKEYAVYIRRAMSARGFVESDFATADIAVFLAYGIGDPAQNQYSYSIPTYGQTGVSSATTYGNTTTFTPTYGITGSTSYSGTYSTYTRFLSLDAVDLVRYRATADHEQVWKTTVISTGSSGDLRRVFPILAVAAEPYIGSNTGNKVRVSLTEADERVRAMKGLTSVTLP